MPRLAALLLSTLAALVATATPAPEPKPWVTGWDKPVDPKGDCRFERKGERLTVTVPGNGHGAEEGNDPRLLCSVEGDFVMEVRVHADCWNSDDVNGYLLAGILAAEGKNRQGLRLVYEGRPENGRGLVKFHPEGGRIVSFSWKSAYLRLERWGDEWRLYCSEDGKEWEDLVGLWGCEMPRQVKVGVVAEVTADGEFKVTFDHFKLTRPAK